MIVIPMAGMSSRFTKAGYDRPKWMLPLADRPLLDWSLMGFNAYFDDEQFLIIHLDQPGVGDFIAERAAALGIKKIRLATLDRMTKGQAETVFLGLEQAGVAAEESITIFNIDTIRPRFGKSERLQQSDGWLECFKGEGDHWSFVRGSTDEPGRAVEVVEKRRISDNCCTGMYYFRSGTLYDTYFHKEAADPQMAELYVAPIYQRMIDDGLVVSYDVIGDDEIVFSGTPDEYEATRRDEAHLAARF